MSSMMIDLCSGLKRFNESKWRIQRAGFGAFNLAQVVLPHPAGPTNTKLVAVLSQVRTSSSMRSQASGLKLAVHSY